MRARRLESCAKGGVLQSCPMAIYHLSSAAHISVTSRVLQLTGNLRVRWSETSQIHTVGKFPAAFNPASSENSSRQPAGSPSRLLLCALYKLFRAFPPPTLHAPTRQHQHRTTRATRTTRSTCRHQVSSMDQCLLIPTQKTTAIIKGWNSVTHLASRPSVESKCRPRFYNSS